MTLLEQWREMAYDDKKSPQAQQMFWANYFNLEKGVYIDLLKSYGEPVKGTVKELAEKYNFDIMTMVGFLDGINDSLKNPNPIETMDEDTVVSLAFDKESLYKNMVDALDEMTICSIGTYVIDKINEQDAKLLASKGIK